MRHHGSIPSGFEGARRGFSRIQSRKGIVRGVSGEKGEGEKASGRSRGWPPGDFFPQEKGLTGFVGGRQKDKRRQLPSYREIHLGNLEQERVQSCRQRPLRKGFREGDALQHTFFSGVASRIIPSLAVLTRWPGRTYSAGQPGAALHGTSIAPARATDGRNGIFKSAFYGIRAWQACRGPLCIRLAAPGRARRQTGHASRKLTRLTKTAG